VPRAEGEPGPGSGARHLLRPSAGDTLDRRGLKVALDELFWKRATDLLSGETLERGGVALTLRLERTMVLFGMVFPAQSHASQVRCEFPVVEVHRMRAALDSVADALAERVTLTWVHTHPRLGVFLSGTDVRTAADWRQLDPGFTPIVIDAHQSALTRRIGVFDGSGQPIAPLGLVRGLIQPGSAQILERAVQETYRADGQPPPTVILSGPRRADGPGLADRDDARTAS
jgi:hypothetical protein